MKMENKILLSNRYMYLSGGVMVIFMFVSFAIFSDYFNVLFFTDPGPWGSIEKLMEMWFSLEDYMVEGYSLMQMIAPLFPILAILPFFGEKEMLPLSLHRTQRPARFVWRKILKYCFWTSLFLYGVSLLYQVFGLFFVKIPRHAGVSRELFNEILGKDFYSNHMFVYFMLESFVKFFVFGFAYALFAMSLSFLLKKRYQLVLVPLLYFDGLSIIVSLFNRFDGINLFFLAPNYVVMSNAAPSMGTWTVFMPLVPVVLFSVLVIRHKLKNGDDPTDV